MRDKECGSFWWWLEMALVVVLLIVIVLGAVLIWPFLLADYIKVKIKGQEKVKYRWVDPNELTGGSV